METQINTKALQNDQRHLKVVKSCGKDTQQAPKGPTGKPKGAQRVPKWCPGAPKAPQKASQSDSQTTPEYEPSSEMLISPKCL